MPKKTGLIFVILGAVLLLAALSLYVYNQVESQRAGKLADSLLADIQASLEGEDVDLGGYTCLGYLTIPDLGLELPVLDEWDYSRLKVAPCRQFGSVKTHNLVIAGHNYRTHFATLKNIKVGATVYFTDMEGDTYTYQVVTTSIIDPDAVATVEDSGYDLVLYTCSHNGTRRFTVFCNRSDL